MVFFRAISGIYFLYIYFDCGTANIQELNNEKNRVTPNPTLTTTGDGGLHEAEWIIGMKLRRLAQLFHHDGIAVFRRLSRL